MHDQFCQLKDVSVLVTGSEGFIGSHLVEELVKQGAKVRCFVLYNSFNSWGWLDTIPAVTRAKIEVFCGDIRDPHGVKKALEGIHTVFHLAALIAIPFSYHSPDSYVDTNIRGTLNVLQAARELRVKRIIVTSTSEVYGTARYVPIDEAHPLQGQSPYSASKIGADQLAMSFFCSFELPVVIVRPFNTFGPRQSCRAIIPTVIAQIAGGNKRIEVGSLTPTRDFNYVSETARGFMLAACANKVEGEVINIGSGREISIGECISLIAKMMGQEVVVVRDESRIRPNASEVERLVCNNSKAANLLGWRPDKTFEGGLKETIDWFTQAENLSKYKAGVYNI